jgi:hypothetical protein
MMPSEQSDYFVPRLPTRSMKRRTLYEQSLIKRKEEERADAPNVNELSAGGRSLEWKSVRAP